MPHKIQRNAAEKAIIALAALTSGGHISDVARTYGVHRNQARKWRDVLRDRAAELFAAVDPKAAATEPAQLQEEIEILRRENAFLGHVIGSQGAAWRAAMIDRAYPLPLTQQAAALGISRRDIYPRNARTGRGLKGGIQLDWVAMYCQGEPNWRGIVQTLCRTYPGAGIVALEGILRANGHPTSYRALRRIIDEEQISLPPKKEAHRFGQQARAILRNGEPKYPLDGPAKRWQAELLKEIRSRYPRHFGAGWM